MASTKKLKKRVLLFLVLLLVVFDGVLLYAAAREARGNILSVSFLDVGQGDAIFIEAPNGAQLLLDGGPNWNVLRELGRLMPFYDRSIDIVLASHADQDHIGGLPDVLSRFSVGSVVEGGTLAATAAYGALGRDISLEKATHPILHAGDRIVLDKKRGVVMDILFPDRDASEFDTNVGSIVARLSYGDTCFILTGDSPVAIEKYLVQKYGKAIDCDVLKVGHHGSDTSSSPEFILAVSPKYAVISVGKDNKYGHPKASVLKTLSTSGAEILRTDERGTITFQTDGKDLLLK